MQYINALSQTTTVIDWLTNSRCPSVLHVFDRACNLINEKRNVLSVVTPEIGNGPFNLVVDSIVLSDHIDLQSEVSISPNQLTLGDWMVNTGSAELWSARPKWDALKHKRETIVHFMTALSNTLLKPLLPDSLLDSFSIALAKANISTALIVTSRLAGLGIGLTPAGDDFIMGGLYGAWISHPPDVAERLAQEIAETAAPLTTSLSAEWLRSAGRGEAGIGWHEFFDVLLTGSAVEPTHLRDKVEQILEVGETSGADALAGFVGTLIASTKVTP